MPFTGFTPSQRVDAVLAQNAALDLVPDMLADLRDADIRHARTQSAGDYLTVLKLQDELLGIIGDVFGMNMDEQRAWLATQALSECGYSLKEECYVPAGRAA